jgi:hypothetical protein
MSSLILHVKGGMSGLVPEPNSESYAMQCFPLYSLLLATGSTNMSSFTLKN